MRQQTARHIRSDAEPLAHLADPLRAYLMLELDDPIASLRSICVAI
jgi:hypothetical protein